MLAWSLAPCAQADHDMLHRERCELTHLVLEDCPNLVKATFVDEYKHHWSFQVAGPIAMFKKLETYSREPQTVLIVDFATADSTENRRMLVAKDAWFLYDATGDEGVCQKPYIYAFKSKDDALKAQPKLKGQLLQWDAVAAKAKKVAADWLPTGKHHIALQGRPEPDD